MNDLKLETEFNHYAKAKGFYIKLEIEIRVYISSLKDFTLYDLYNRFYSEKSTHIDLIVADLYAYGRIKHLAVTDYGCLYAYVN